MHGIFKIRPMIYVNQQTVNGNTIFHQNINTVV